MKKGLILAVFVFTAMSFTNINNKTDDVLPEDCMQLSIDVQAWYESKGTSTDVANELANVTYVKCMAL